MDIEQLKYPIGKYVAPTEITEKEIKAWIKDLKNLPKQLAKTTKRLSNKQLDTPYRHEGWTVRQVVHHVADSHMNAYIRFKLALTEHNPTIKPYDENAWANLEDSKGNIKTSLEILKNLHKRWVTTIKAMSPEDFEKTMVHPGLGKTVSLKFMLGLYSWHSRHHTAHISNLAKRMDW